MKLTEFDISGSTREYSSQMFRLNFEEEDIGREQLFLPDGLFSIIYLHSGELVLNRSLSYKGPSVLFALYTEAQIVYPRSKCVIYGQTFRPVVADNFDCISIPEMTNRFVKLEEIHMELSDKYISFVIDRPDSLALSNFQYLLQNISRRSNDYSRDIRNFVVSNILSQKGYGNLNDLGRHTGVSQRKLQQIFKDSFGLTMKNYSNICRFNAAKDLINKGDSRSLVEIAYKLEYTDLPHMNREFKRFGLIAPSHYMASDPGMHKYFGTYQISGGLK